MKLSTLQRICLLVIVCNLLLFTMACSTAWISTALGILQTLMPAIASLLTLLGTVGLSSSALTAWQKWSTDASAGLGTVQTLINEYNTAEATSQPGILAQIDNIMNAVVSQLTALLPELQITNPAHQQTITAMITEWAAEAEALINLIPVINGKVTDHDEVKAKLAALKSAKQFKKDWNANIDKLALPAAEKAKI
jgi:hypothetical protein